MSDSEIRILERAANLGDLQATFSLARHQARAKIALEAWVRDDLFDGVCQHCKEQTTVGYEPSRTMYHWDGKGEDPNRDVLLCAKCSCEHHYYWDAMWDTTMMGY